MPVKNGILILKKLQGRVKINKEGREFSVKAVNRQKSSKATQLRHGKLAVHHCLMTLHCFLSLIFQ